MEQQDQHGHEDHHGNVRIHIDREAYESPNPTVGDALYALAKIAADFGLYREQVEGENEDRLIPRANEAVHLKQDEHFYSAKLEFKIFVNTRPKTVAEDVLTFAAVTELAFPGPHEEKTFFTVSYRKAADDKHGTLTVGQSVEIKDGTIFDVTKGDKS